MSFQEQMDRLRDGDTLTLDRPAECAGPVVIHRRITLDGRNHAVVWASTHPVVTIEADGVVLKNLRVENTLPAGSKTTPVAILARGTKLTFDHVTVRGAVKGLPGEEGDWLFPSNLYLGKFDATMPRHGRLRIWVPVACKLSSEVDGVEIRPADLSAGPNEVEMTINAVRKDTLLYGPITLRTKAFRRVLTINAHGVAPEELTSEDLTPDVCWEPADWAALVARHRQGTRPSPPPATVPPPVTAGLTGGNPVASQSPPTTRRIRPANPLGSLFATKSEEPSPVPPAPAVESPVETAPPPVVTRKKVATLSALFQPKAEGPPPDKPAS